MIRTGLTVNEAAHEWVKEMNAIPQEMIAKLMEYDIDDWQEVTAPAIGDRVYVFELPEDCDSSSDNGEVTGIYTDTDEDEKSYEIELDDGEVIRTAADNFEVEYDGGLPMWGTMWSFGDSVDDLWLEDDGGIEKMSECGFRIFKSEEFGYFFGIDGAGYNFYEQHWEPLYRVRGLHWHDTDEVA